MLGCCFPYWTPASTTVSFSWLCAMTRPAKGRPRLFQWVSSTSTHWPAYCASICSSEDTPWGNRVVFFFLAIFLGLLLRCATDVQRRGIARCLLWLALWLHQAPT